MALLQETAPGQSQGSSLRVLIVTNMYPCEDAPALGAFVMRQVEGLRGLGHVVDVLHIEGRRSKFRYLAGAFQVLASTRRTPYDIVHAHYGLSGVPALFRWRSPLVVTIHGSDALSGVLQPMISSVVCRLADAVIVVSKGIRARISGEVIPCGIDLERFQPGERAVARARLGLPMDRRLVLFPYDRRRRVKRYDLALAAIQRLGEGDVECIAVSGVANEEMPWYYRAADVVLLCSESEGSPTSVKEALACNIPVVSTDVGDVVEIVEGIEGCEICDPDAVSLAEGLRRVLNRKERAFEGRSAMTKYDERRVIEAVVQVYRRALDRRSWGKPSRTSEA